MLRAAFVIDYQNVHMTAADLLSIADSRTSITTGNSTGDASHQATQWRTDGAMVELRDLKYTFQRAADGRPVVDVNGKKIPYGRPQEKGIDVLCALACVREAVDPAIDLVVLASRDTDLVPVLDELYDQRGRDPERCAKIETVSWFNTEARRLGRYAGGSLQPTAPRRIWNTNLNRACYEASLDRRDYR